MTKKKDPFEKEREIFLEHIQKAGLRRTGQRDLIMEIFLDTEEHLTSEDLYWLVQQQDPTVGHTTVASPATSTNDTRWIDASQDARSASEALTDGHPAASRQPATPVDSQIASGPTRSTGWSGLI